MNGCYPPVVTGNEPEIIGSGTEDKCARCLEKADEEMTLAGIPDSVVEVDGEWLCQDCADEGN